MRKMMFLLLGAMLLLTACGSGSSSGPATHSTKGKVYNHEFGKKFLYHRQNVLTKQTSKVEIILSDYEIVKEKSVDDANKDNVDYIKVYVQAENVGKENSTDLAVRSNSFKVYDANGKDISSLAFSLGYQENEFEPAELRPGGKNEGYLYIPFEEGAVPAELIYYDSTNKSGSYTNQYVFKL